MENVDFKVEPPDEWNIGVQSDWPNDDIKPSITLTEFKQEFDPSVSTDNLSFNPSTSDASENDSKDNHFSYIPLTNDAIEDILLPKCPNDDIKPPIALSEFKQELDPSVSTDNLSQSTFNPSTSDANENDSKDNHFPFIPLSNDATATEDVVLPECPNNDIKPSITLTEFKQELDQSTSTESDIVNLPQPTFMVTMSDINGLNLKNLNFSQILWSKEARTEHFYRESLYHSNSEKHIPNCLNYQEKDEVDVIKKESPYIISSSTSDHPIMIQSEVDDFVSGNEDLENDVAGKLCQDHNYFHNDLRIASYKKPVEQATGEKTIEHDKCKSGIKCDNKNLDSQIQMSGKEHLGEKHFQCKDCGKYFIYRCLLEQHMRIHTGEKPFKCKECGKSFPWYSHFQRHMRIHRGEKEFECKECGKCFTERGNLHKHMRIHTTDKPFKCRICGKCFGDNDRLQRHRSIHPGETSDLQSQLDGKKPFECMDCGRSFLKRSLFQQHRRIHTGEKPFKCKECGKCFPYKNSLRNHLRTHIKKESPVEVEKTFKCKECDKNYAAFTGLQQHNKRKHSGEKPFNCKECGKYFITKQELKVHTRTHTGEKPFQCKDCEKSFAAKANFLRHIRIHSEEKKFQCKECVKCFYAEEELQVHMRIHTGEKPFKCKECGKGYTVKKSLLRHMKIHTGENLYQCNECEKYFTENCKAQLCMRKHENKRKALQCYLVFRSSSTVR